MEFNPIQGGVCAPQGFVAGGLHCGIRKNQDKNDLALIFSQAECAAACVYTQNKVAGAPIAITRKNVQNGKARAIVCNSGNANTCNADGLEIAQTMCDLTAQALSISPDEVVVASTGVIGQPLSIAPIESGLPKLAEKLSRQGHTEACLGIMTTDTVPKETAYAFSLGGAACAIGAMSKGSGMIHPNMATMLAFVTTDVAIAPALLQKALSHVVQDTFNMLSIDGDTSTNDMLTVLANGQAHNTPIETENQDYDAFVQALYTVCQELCKKMARDGEGATKLLECRVVNAPLKQTAQKIAKSVICSTLFKAAMFGADANWGRILCAIGYTDAAFDIAKINVVLSSDKGALPVCQNGAGLAFCEEKAKEILSEGTIGILVDMQDGTASAMAWGCDLTYDYVKINGDYRT